MFIYLITLMNMNYRVKFICAAVITLNQALIGWTSFSDGWKSCNACN